MIFLIIDNCARGLYKYRHNAVKLFNDCLFYVNASTMSFEKFSCHSQYGSFKSNVWYEFSRLAAEFKVLNLGLGFPDFGPPDYLTAALAEIAQSSSSAFHQYTRDFGHPRLVQAVSQLYSKVTNREINPLTEILITNGAQQALYCSILGHTNPGDEVIIIEPFFDPYLSIVSAADGIPVFIPLHPKPKFDGPLLSCDWVLDPDELTSKFNSRTKSIILNTPQNPLGKVFSLDELNLIADLCKKWNVLCISDEVYEWLVFKPYKHIRIATLPDMWDRTITICSASKTFSVTGWRLGWAYGPSNLIDNLQIVHKICAHTCPTPIQEAVARGLELEFSRIDSPDSYFQVISSTLKSKCDFMAKFLTDVGMKPTIPQGGYFIIADWTNLESRVDLSEESDVWRDYRFAKWMSKNIKLQGFPSSAFYGDRNKHIGEDYIRYCFVKKDENLQKAAKILQEWKEKTNENF